MATKTKARAKKVPVRKSKTETAAKHISNVPRIIEVKDVHTRAMLVNFSASTWMARKFDKKVTEEVETSHNVQDAGRFNKQLLAGAREMHMAVIAAVQAWRVWHYENTLPWGNDGWRLLPSSNFMAYTEGERKHRINVESALAKFYDNYDVIVEDAKRQLKTMFNADDYPSLHELKKKFAFSVDFMPLPKQGDFRLDELPADELARIEQQTQTRVQRALQDAIYDAWQKLFTHVQKISQTLHEKDKIFRNSLIENVRELIQILRKLNFVDDVDLNKMIAEVEKLIDVDPDDLRADEKLRKSVAEDADAIMKQMASIYGSLTT